MFGYACDETEELMPLPILLAHKLAFALSARRKDHTLKWLRPDGKSQVSVKYDGIAPVGVDVEWIRPMRDGLDIAERFFSPRESTTLRAVPAARRAPPAPKPRSCDLPKNRWNGEIPDRTTEAPQSSAA